MDTYIHHFDVYRSKLDTPECCEKILPKKKLRV